MFRFHIQGLSVCVLGPSRLDVLMLNSGPPRKRSMPFHLQHMFCPRQAVASYSASRLASISGLWVETLLKPDGAPAFVSDATHLGFSLSGLHATIGAGGPPERPADGLAPDARNPDRNKPDWSSLHWALRADRMLPSGHLLDEFRVLGPNTFSVISFHGGRLEGGVPSSVAGRQLVWSVRAGYVQAFTDTIDVVYDEAPPATLRDADNQEVGQIEFEPNGEAWLINEAPERSKQFATLGAAVGQQTDFKDCMLYQDAFDAPAEEKSGISVHSVSNFVTDFIFSGASCEALFVEEG